MELRPFLQGLLMDFGDVHHDTAVDLLFNRALERKALVPFFDRLILLISRMSNEKCLFFKGKAMIRVPWSKPSA